MSYRSLEAIPKELLSRDERSDSGRMQGHYAGVAHIATRGRSYLPVVRGPGAETTKGTSASQLRDDDTPGRTVPEILRKYRCMVERTMTPKYIHYNKVRVK
ncbi:hypothetical protein E4U57_004698 [Claviceps arundinis]|uniref:Uncharacterized protein n=1 Tax=Claviceps arundinis TaxID=1623583 RepID=A0A9P7MSV2_9HYPO|nr:hypothetical protein E4U57_004698 [Claviceps arundinis]KAG5967131.1 hypothetical protein E4U56_000995 [Claviceps arundinis]